MRFTGDALSNRGANVYHCARNFTSRLMAGAGFFALLDANGPYAEDDLTPTVFGIQDRPSNHAAE